MTRKTSLRPAVGQLAAFQPLGPTGRKVGPPRMGWLLRAWDDEPERWTIRWVNPRPLRSPEPTLRLDQFRVVKLYDDGWLEGYGPKAAADTDTDAPDAQRAG